MTYQSINERTSNIEKVGRRKSKKLQAPINQRCYLSFKRKQFCCTRFFLCSKAIILAISLETQQHKREINHQDYSGFWCYSHQASFSPASHSPLREGQKQQFEIYIPSQMVYLIQVFVNLQGKTAITYSIFSSIVGAERKKELIHIMKKTEANLTPPFNKEQPPSLHFLSSFLCIC